jgi:hypothetical protein
MRVKVCCKATKSRCAPYAGTVNRINGSGESRPEAGRRDMRADARCQTVERASEQCEGAKRESM